MKTALFAATAALLAAACASTQTATTSAPTTDAAADLSAPPADLLADAPVAFELDSGGFDAVRGEYVLTRSNGASQSFSAEALQGRMTTAYADVSRIVQDPQAGVLIAYTEAGGRAHLWAPDRSEVIEGTWSVRERDLPTGAARPAKVMEVCFDYADDAYDVCRDALDVVAGRGARLIDAAAGDTFGLKSQGVPYVRGFDEIAAWTK